ncbi:MAG: zf-TFIIB domain-containing protein [Oscillospiraceae bacterium]|nr:zf-TFIIB domain-containing protein [Oscillospiraceae bacterium]
MKCPRCGHEMNTDTHRKYAVQMCYQCGYMEGRDMGGAPVRGETNFSRMKSLNFNELVAFLSAELKLDPVALADWLDNTAD